MVNLSNVLGRFFLSFFLIMLFVTNSYAIRVTVKSSSKNVSALGFTVNGQKFGGVGNSYVNEDSPKGTYQFGVRAANDIGCTNKGKKSVKLTTDTTAVLTLTGNKCTMSISSK